MTNNVDIGREAVEQFCEFRIPEPVKDVLLAMRDALDKAEKETAFQLQRAATSEAEIAELKVNELRLHQIIYKLSDKGKQADATIALRDALDTLQEAAHAEIVRLREETARLDDTIARQQRAIERKDTALALFIAHSTGSSGPNGQSTIGWFSSDGMSANQRIEVARAAIAYDGSVL